MGCVTLIGKFVFLTFTVGKRYMTGSKPTKILLIEDNSGDTRLIQEMLSEVSGFSFHMECVDCLSTGLERLAKRGIDLILFEQA